MRASAAPNGFDLWEALDGIREAFASTVGRHPRSGDIRTAVLVSLIDEPMHGYQIIQAIETRTDGAWEPTPGAVYPTLQLLTDEGLVTAEQVGERKVYALTDAGRAAADSTDDDAAGGAGRARFERNLAAPKAGVKLAQAAALVAQNGTPAQSERAVAIIDEARRKLYAILAED